MVGKISAMKIRVLYDATVKKSDIPRTVVDAKT
jgi:hypothetical protein